MTSRGKAEEGLEKTGPDQSVGLGKVAWGAGPREAKLNSRVAGRVLGRQITYT